MPKPETQSDVLPDDVLTVKQFCEKYRAFPEGGVRWQIFNEDRNGLREAGAILKVRKRRYVDVPRYFTWLRAGSRRAA